MEGYVIDIEGAAGFVGKVARVLITKTFKTYAKAKIIE
jgi:predicted RNA-binding protein with TRAM domain